MAIPGRLPESACHTSPDPRSLAWPLQIIRPVLMALSYLHGLGILHRVRTGCQIISHLRIRPGLGATCAFRAHQGD